jgi:hypothetical protein
MLSTKIFTFCLHVTEKKRGPYLQGLDHVVFFNKREAFCTRNERQKIGVQGLAPAGFLF